MEVAEVRITRKDKVANLRKHHEPLFEALKIPNAYFDSKARNAKLPGTIGAVGFFESQLKDSEDIYFEINDFSQKVIDPKRTLYKLKANPHFSSEPEKYQYIADTPAGPQYYVAMNHFEEVRYPGIKDPVIEVREITDWGDIHLDNLTARDWACIHLKVPQSNHKWLDDLIKQSNNS